MSIFNKVTKTFQWGQHKVVLETGEMARQASGAVVVDIEGTVVLCTVVASKTAKPGQDFFPLTVDYIEKTYACLLYTSDAADERSSVALGGRRNITKKKKNKPNLAEARQSEKTQPWT